MEKTKVKVTIENIDELKSLSKKLDEQTSELYSTIDKISKLNLFLYTDLSINQQDQ